MKKLLFQRLTALVLVLAMTLSLTGTAFAEELTGDASGALPESSGAADTDEGLDEPTESAAEESTDPADGSSAPATDDAAESSGSDSTPNTDPADTDPADTDPADGSSSADGSGSTPGDDSVIPASDETLGWVVVADSSEETDSSESGEVVSTTSEGSGEETAAADETVSVGEEDASAEGEEAVTTASSGETTASTHYEFHYKDAKGKVTQLKNGYYYLPEVKIDTTNSYKKGIYYFNEEGWLAEEEDIEKLYTSTKADKKTAVSVLNSGDAVDNGDYKTAYKTVTYDSAAKNYTVSTTETRKILYIADASGVYDKTTKTWGETDPAVAAPYALHTGCIRKENVKTLWCVSGELYSGFWRCAANTEKYNTAGYDTRLYYIKKGVAGKYKGVMTEKSATILGITAQYYCNGKKQAKLEGAGYCYNNGKPYHGLFTEALAKGTENYGWYSKGKFNNKVNGWWYYNKDTRKWSQKPFTTAVNKKKQVSGTINKVFYFKNGYVLRSQNNVKLKSMGGSGYYYYTFQSNGQLVTNLFKYNSAYKRKKLKIVVSRKTHTTTIFAYNSKSGDYDIPCKSFVVATAKKSSRYHSGTYKLGRRKAWMNDQQATGNPLSKCSWYRYATHISGSGALFHSSNYYKKGQLNTMRAKVYNQLGTNVTSACVRCQTVNCKLIYELSKINSGIKVSLGYSSSNTPFGKMTLSYNYDHTGGVKVPSNNRTKDPTGSMSIW